MATNSKKVFVDSGSANLLLERFNQQRISGEDCNFLITNGHRTESVHRALLRAISETINQFCRDSSIGLFTLPNVSDNELIILVDYFYTTKLALNSSTVCGLYAAAKYLKINFVIQSCTEYLRDNLAADNCISQLLFAVEKKYEELQIICIAYCIAHFEDVISREDCLQLPFETFHQILSSPKLFVTEEEKLYRLMRRWIDEKPTERQKYTEQLSVTIRYQLIGVSILLDILRLEENAVILDHVRKALVEVGTLAEAGAQRRWSRQINTRGDDVDKHAVVMRPKSLHVTELDKSIKRNDPSSDESYGSTNSLERDDPSTQASPALVEDKSRVPEPESWYKTDPILAIFGGRTTERKLLRDVVCYRVAIESPTSPDHPSITSIYPTLGLLDSPLRNLKLPRHRKGFGASLLNGQVFLTGGLPSNAMRTVDVYDLASEQWLVGPPLTVGRAWHGVASVDRLIFVLGGSDSKGQTLSDSEVFDSRSGIWQAIPRMPKGRMSLGACIAGKQLIVAGGVDDASADCFDLVAGKWRSVAPLPCDHQAPNLLEHNGRIHVFGGATSAGAMDCVHTWVETENRWTSLSRMPLPRAFAACAKFQNHAFILGGRGETTSSCSEIQVFDFITKQWKVMTHRLPSGRSSSCALVIPP